MLKSKNRRTRRWRVAVLRWALSFKCWLAECVNKWNLYVVECFPAGEMGENARKWCALEVVFNRHESIFFLLVMFFFFSRLCLSLCFSVVVVIISAQFARICYWAFDKNETLRFNASWNTILMDSDKMLVFNESVSVQTRKPLNGPERKRAWRTV